MKASVTPLRKETIAAADFSQLCILVIDDSPYMRRLVAEMLHSFGVGKVVGAASAREAFAQMQLNSPDMVFCDWEMYPDDGLSVLRQFRQANSAYIPFIMLTGHNGQEDVTLALGEGADSYIVKPFTSETLMNHLLKVIVAQPAQAQEEWSLD